ncbi:MAG: hypothetical protein ACLS61_06315 [Ruminococcus sp.]
MKIIGKIIENKKEKSCWRMYPKMVVYLLHSQGAGAKQLKPVSRLEKLFKKIKSC